MIGWDRSGKRGLSLPPACRRRRDPRVVALVMISLLGPGLNLGCAGDSNAPADDADDIDGDPIAAPDERGGIVLPADCREVSPGRVGLQRLTGTDYDRTVRDLFGVTSTPSDAFPPDSATSGFSNNAGSLKVSPQLAELLVDAAESVAAQAMKNRRDEILICDPKTDGPDACARTILKTLARRVYRRPADVDELDDLMQFVKQAADDGDSFESGIQSALWAMLSSPQFLFRGLPADGSGGGMDVARLDDYALATRLSYFLWGTTPDDRLLDRAGAGDLGGAIGLRQEFDRMLTDARAGTLYDGFISPWLALGKLGSAAPDAQLFPMFSEDLRKQMWGEVRAFFEDMRARDGSALDFIRGTRTFADQTLGSIYGVPGVEGSELQAIDLNPGRRAGVLTMPAILTMTSGPDKPNIVRRGAWLAESILCASPPPPPDDVPAEPMALPNETERERLARHRQDPSCAPCHNLLDPLGFAFENYDAIGRWQDSDDNRGSLPDGQSFDGVVEMSRLVASSGDFGACITEKLMTFALGRTVSAEERCLLQAIGAQTVGPDSKLSDLLWAVVRSAPFASETGDLP